MNFIIVADIRGFKYYIKVEKTAGPVIFSFSYQGLKNNATTWGNEEAANNAIKKINDKSPWEMKVIGY